MMTYDLRDLFEEDIPDETAYHLGNFLYALASAFESVYYGKISRYNQSQTELYNDLRKQSEELGSQNSDQRTDTKEDLQDF
jgi:hypothetical protein